MVKYFSDIVAALFLIVLSSPLFLLIGTLVKFNIGSPLIFVQKRAGLRGNIFNLYKFRTMADIRGADGKLLPDEQRLSSFGRILRATSLDELPTLINVLKREMSLVGPRPLLVEYLDRYTAEQARRHEVRPGITGLAQVNGRNAITWEKKFELDVWYVDNRTLWLDIKIIFLTIWKILKGEGISQEGHATMEKFMRTHRDV